MPCVRLILDPFDLSAYSEHQPAALVPFLIEQFPEGWPATARLRLGTLHEHQVTWRREQADGLRAYFDKNGIEHDGVDPGWPVYSTLPSAVAA